MLPQTSQAVEKGILQDVDHIQGIDRRERLYSTHPVKESVFSLLRRKTEFWNKWGEMGVEIISGLEFSKEFKIIEVKCQLQAHIHQQRQHKFIYILILPAQEGAIFLVDKCKVFRLQHAYFRNPKMCSCPY